MESEILAKWVHAIGSIIGIFTAIATVWWQMRRQWLLSSSTSLMNLADIWGNEDWRRYRQHSAESLNKRINGELIDLSKDLPVLGFFENLGHICRRGGLDKKMIWNKFGWYIVRYYLALTFEVNLIEEIREKEQDETLWDELVWLNTEMLKIYRKKGVTILTKEKLLVSENKKIRISELFEQELNLKIDSTQRPLRNLE